MTANYPPKQQVRDYMQRRAKATTPPPSPEEIQIELGWQMIEAERAAQKGIK